MPSSAKKSMKSWVKHEQKDAWIERSRQVHNSGALTADSSVQAIQNTKTKINNIKDKFREENKIIYVLVSIFLSLLPMFVLSSLVKFHLVHLKKLIFAIILIAIVQYLGKLLKINM